MRAGSGRSRGRWRRQCPVAPATRRRVGILEDNPSRPGLEQVDTYSEAAAIADHTHGLASDPHVVRGRTFRVGAGHPIWLARVATGLQVDATVEQEIDDWLRRRAPRQTCRPVAKRDHSVSCCRAGVQERCRRA